MRDRLMNWLVPSVRRISEPNPRGSGAQKVGGACSPLVGATFDVWHASAASKYSDEAANNTVGQKFLRGYQTTDANGDVRPEPSEGNGRHPRMSSALL